MSAIQFGVVIPQGWSYDFHLLDKMLYEPQIHFRSYHSHQSTIKRWEDDR